MNSTAEFAIDVELHSADWHYKCEGHGNMVLCYRGTNPALLGKVLRLKKTNTSLSTPSATDDSVSKGSDTQQQTAATTAVAAADAHLLEYQQDFVFRFMRHVMRPLLGHKWVDCGVKVHVTREFLTQVAADAASFRPAYRRHSGRDVDLDAPYAILITDHTDRHAFDWSIGDAVGIEESTSESNAAEADTPVYCIEIKPKWGVMCRSHLIHEDHHKWKHFVCRYCMHQRLKLHKKEIRRVSTFCPIDLFATHDEVRMRRALEGLVHEPQNNFRIFVNGDLVWSGENDVDDESEQPAPLHSIGRLAAMLRRYPLPQIHAQDSQQVVESNDQALVDNLIEIIQRCLVESTVLPSIQRLQLLDKLDVEAAHVIYERLLQKYSLEQLHHMLFDLSAEDRVSNWVQRLERELHVIEQAASVKFECLSKRPNDINSTNLEREDLLTHDMDDILDRCKSDDEMAVHLLRAFLIAQTAKDCSLMMTLCPVSDAAHLPTQQSSSRIEGVISSQNEGGRQSAVRYRVVVVDLDPKPIAKMPRYHRFDAQVVRTYKQSVLSPQPDNVI